MTDKQQLVDAMCQTWRHDFHLDIRHGPLGYSGMDDYERDALRRQMGQLFDHHVAPYLAKSDAEIEKWSGTAVQNGMECDWLRAKLAEARALLIAADDELADWSRSFPDTNSHETDAVRERICTWLERNP